MSVLLYINGQVVDIDKDTHIAQTKQVNDINSVSNREANYTNTFQLPMTANNVKIMQFLSLPGNKSNVPYQKNECSLYSDTGECFVYKGWAIITQSGDKYKVIIYDGIIDFYKNIENKNFSNIVMAELNHLKSIEAIKLTWASELNYRYILADYNGNTGDTSTGMVNIDYLVPAVSVAYLWDKIFETFGGGGLGVGYSGTVFLTENFKNLWMTYPKGISTSDSETDIFVSDDYGFLSSLPPFTDGPVLDKYYAKFLSSTTDDLESSLDGIHLKVEEAGTYRLELSGNIRSIISLYDEEGNLTSSFPDNFNMYIVKNAEGLTAIEAVQFQSDILVNQPPLTDFTGPEYFITLDALDSFAIVIEQSNNWSDSRFTVVSADSDLSVTLVKLNQNEIDFENALIDLSIRDFVTEVVTRFGLTMFKDKYNNTYEFLTLQDLLQTSEIINWSDKYSRKIDENYTHGNYAQQNWLKYAYNDKESSHNDGFIEVDNVNLPDSKNIIQSKIYSPESFENRTMYLNRLGNVYKLWDKELVENPGVDEDPYKYKSLDKRYYFMRAEGKTQDITLESKVLGQVDETTTGFFYIESYYKLPFRDIVQDYYLPLQQILDKSVLMNVELWLKETDVINFDFRKLYYIEQLSSYFLVNRINNYIPGRPTKCELIKVNYAPL